MIMFNESRLFSQKVLRFIIIDTVQILAGIRNGFIETSNTTCVIKCDEIKIRACVDKRDLGATSCCTPVLGLSLIAINV